MEEKGIVYYLLLDEIKKYAYNKRKCIICANVQICSALARWRIYMKKRMIIFLLGFLGSITLMGCKKTASSYGLNPKQPTTIQVWHYYNGAQKNSFDAMVREFNETIGAKNGIIVEGHSQGSVNELEESVIDAINKKVGSEDAPNIFASYADTAFEVEQMGMLANLDNYFTPKEQEEYVESFIEEGRIGAEKELKIFPIAKSTEIFMLNKTDWDKFAQATGATLEQLNTKEGVVEVAKQYYEWTDSLTPDIKEDGKAFYGRDAMANLFIVGTKQLGKDIFQVENQQITLHVEKEIMRKIWDTYYIPYINGYFAAIGKFRSDDAKVGEIIAYVGSTTSAVYFPTEVTIQEDIYPVESLVLPVPKFKDGEDYAVQQGAGMVVLKAEEKEEYASVLFLKWFTEKERNISFSCTSGYIPVKKEANDYEVFQETAKENQEEVPEVIDKTLQVAFHILKQNTLYTNKAFKGGKDARKILEYHLPDKAEADLKLIKEKISEGMTREEAVALFDTEENFEQWFEEFKQALENVVK